MQYAREISAGSISGNEIDKTLQVFGSKEKMLHFIARKKKMYDAVGTVVFVYFIGKISPGIRTV